MLDFKNSIWQFFPLEPVWKTLIKSWVYFCVSQCTIYITAGTDIWLLVVLGHLFLVYALLLRGYTLYLNRDRSFIFRGEVCLPGNLKIIIKLFFYMKNKYFLFKVYQQFLFWKLQGKHQSGPDIIFFSSPGHRHVSFCHG